MLKKDLLEVEKRKPTIRPRYRDVDEYRPVAQDVIDVYEPGKTRGEIETEVGDLETHDTFKLVRSLSELLDRRAEFEQRAPAPPEQLREAVFGRGYVTSEAERNRVLEAVAEEFNLSPTEVEDGLWADHDAEHVLVEPPDIGPMALLRQYNLSLTQTLLFDALELEFSVSGNYQAIFSYLKYLGMMYTVDEDLTVHVTGPASLFRKTRKYGTTMAKLVPSIMKADEWQFAADIETEVSNETRIYEFSLDSDSDHRFPDTEMEESFDSAVERDFATRIDSLVDGWSVTREPTILRTGRRVMIPDFSFERGDDEFYVEVVGFWTPDYLEEKLEKVRQVESEHPIVLAVNEELNCTEGDFARANIDEIFFYCDRIPVKPVVDRINEIDRRTVEADRQELRERMVSVSDTNVVDIEGLAAEHDVTPAAMEAHLESEYPGVISNGQYVPPRVLSELRTAIESNRGTTLADVNPILTEYGVAQDILEEIGYEISYVSLDQSEAEIRLADD